MFRFKEFSIEDSLCTMKVGTDAVLLGAWVSVKKVKRILDVGTGCGIIALMLAQRTTDDVGIEGIEIDEDSVNQAAQNLFQTPWCKRVLMHHHSLQTFTSPVKYDLIVSNPPYFNKSELPPTSGRANARHTRTLSYPDLIQHSIRLLKKKGRLAVILPFAEGNSFVQLASLSGLICVRRLSFYSRIDKPQERWLFEFSFLPTALVNENLVLHGEGNSWSAKYAALTRDFYLKV